jgi:diguanylate cyclase (GGDEF)-like protein
VENHVEDCEAISAQDHSVLLSSRLAGPSERRIALAFVLASGVIFLVTAPMAQVQLAPVWAFIPTYQSALVVNDLITAIFLYGQFAISRSRPILMLATGYLFTACMAMAHALTFPGLFAPSGLLGAGPQSTAWLYMFWHGGFPILVIAYACLSAWDDGKEQPQARSSAAILFSITAVLLAAFACTLVATVGHEAIPAIMQGNQKMPANFAVVSSVWLLSLVALFALWRRRPHSILDLWLTVVMCAWLFDIAMSAVLNAGRFDLGFYIGRMYGLLAASFVLAVLLFENSRLYGQLIATHASDRRKTIELQRLLTIDPLTRIANRRAFEEALDREWRRAVRHNAVLSLLMIDVDEFKLFNDAYGHVAGDECLRAIARVLADNTKRAGDVAARYGGEEFAVLLPYTDLNGAHELAQRMREAVRDLNLPHERSRVANRVTVSVGVASAIGSDPIGASPPRDSASSRTAWRGPTLLVEAADQALYAAKAAGRNRVSLAHVDDLPLAPAEHPLVAMHPAA